MEDWAEIRRLHRAEKLPIKEIVRRLGVARNTVRAALAADRPPRYSRPERGSLVDEVELDVRKLLKEFPRMPSTVIAERIGWEHSITILKDRVRELRPEYAGIDPADRIVHDPGVATQCDLWFPETRIPVGHRQMAMLPVLAMTLTYSRFISAVMLPSRQAGDLLSGMWQLIAALGVVSRTLVWDLESAIGKGGRVSAPAAMFAGTLGTRIRLLAARDPESKGVIERNNGFFETSFLPGRTFTGPADFNTQMAGWLPRANTRLVRATGARPVDAVSVDLAAMTALPPLAPVVGLTNRVRLARDYYVRVDTNDYSVDPRVIGRLVDVTASPTRVNVTCDGMVVAAHERCWAHRVVVSDPAHVATAKGLRAAFSIDRAARERAARHGGDRHHDDGTTVMLRALPDYDALYGVDFTPAPATLDAVTGLASPTVTVPTTGTMAACEPGIVLGPVAGLVSPTVTVPTTGTVAARAPGIVLDPVPRTEALPEPGTVALPEPRIVLGPVAGLVPATVTASPTGTVAAWAPGIVLDPVPRTEAVPEPGTVALPEPVIVLDPVAGLVSPTVTASPTGTVAVPEPGIVLDPEPRTVALPEPGTVALPEPVIVLSPVAGLVSPTATVRTTGTVAAWAPGIVLDPEPRTVTASPTGTVAVPEPGIVLDPVPRTVGVPEPGIVLSPEASIDSVVLQVNR